MQAVAKRVNRGTDTRTSAGSNGATHSSTRVESTASLLQSIPTELVDRRQWVVWRLETRNGRSTKVPYQLTGKRAESDDPTTWAPFDDAVTTCAGGKWSGIGYMFSVDDPFFGIDLDACR